MAEANEDKTTSQLSLANPNDESDSSELIEITTYIRADQAFALEILENTELQRLGEDFDKAKLIQEALDLLIEKHIVVIDLRKNKIVKRSG
jgi:hypothetical protein